MFPQHQRLSQRGDIQAVLKRGRRFTCRSMTLRILKTKLNHCRVTVVVGTVVSKKAVVRNRFKRQLRHILREELKKTNCQKQGFDIMLTVRAPILKKTKEEILQDLRLLCVQAKLF